MELVATLARGGNRIIRLLAGILVLILLLYGTYSLWDTWRTFQDGFADDELMRYKPVGGELPNTTLEDLMTLNPDVCGWITVDDTHIDYPVVQGRDDMEYVNKNIYSEFALSGAIFLSSRNSREFADPYSVIYGHHMANGAMFGDVIYFQEADYFETHTTGTLKLVYRNYEIELFACVACDAYDEVIYQDPDRVTEDKVPALADYIREHSVQYRDIDIQQGDQIIALSTCAEAVTNGRVVLFGRLVQGNVLQEEN